MSRRLLAAAAALLVLAVTLVATTATAGADPRAANPVAPSGSVTIPPHGKVLIISAPRLTWQEVQSTHPENLDRLFAKSALASMSVRTAESSTPPGAAYLTMGAGNRAATDTAVDGEVLDRSETFDRASAQDVYQRLSGVRPTSHILALGFPRLKTINNQSKFGTTVGALADALDAHGRQVAAIANADLDPDVPHRQGALFAADHTGQVHAGAVDPELLVNDGLAPFGLRLDPIAVMGAFDASWPKSDVALVELSDLERAEQARSDMTPGAGDKQFADVLTESDRLVGKLLQRVDLRRDTVMVIGPTSPFSEDGLTVFSIAGPGITPGYATSSTTRRDGFVTLTDIAPTVLDGFGIKVPESMTDTLISTTADSSSLGTKVDHLADVNARTLVRDGSFGTIATIWVVVLIADLIVAVICLARLPKLAPLVSTLALVVLSLPVVSFLGGLLPLAKFTPTTFGILLYAITLIIAIVAAMVGRKRPNVAPIVLIAALWLVLAIDIVSGGNLQINTVFGYSPVVAGRFAGFGNQAYSLFAIAAVIIVTTAWERVVGRPEWRTRFIAASALFFLISIVLDGFPAFGSDVGGVLALVPTAVILLMTLAGRRIRVRTVVIIGTATVAVLAVFAAIDLSRPAKSRTHLGRFVQQLFNGEGVTVLERKLEANWSVFTSSFLTWVIPVALLYIAYLWWRPNHTLEEIRRRYPGFAAFGVAGLMLGLLSMALNDSGVSMPAIMLTMGLSYTTILALGVEAHDSTEDPAAVGTTGATEATGETRATGATTAVQAMEATT